MHVNTAFLVSAAAIAAAVDAKVELSTMSLNVRTAVDGAWDNWRGALMVGFLKQESPDFIGLQENTQKQYDYLLASTDGYASIGGCAKGDGDACAGSERSNIMYKKASWELIDNGDIHLSGDYDHPSETAENTYGLQYQRVVTWGRFKSTKDDSATVCYFNTHYDPGLGHDQSSELVRHQMAQKCKEEDLAMFTADLNAPPESKAYNLLTGDDSPFQLTDALKTVGNRDGTLVGGGDYRAAGGAIFDFVLARANNLCIVNGHVGAGKDNEGRYDSDHRHPVAEFCIGADCSCKNSGGGGNDHAALVNDVAGHLQEYALETDQATEEESSDDGAEEQETNAPETEAPEVKVPGKELLKAEAPKTEAPTPAPTEAEKPELTDAPALATNEEGPNCDGPGRLRH